MFIKRSIAGSLLGALLISTSVSASSELNRLIEQALDADKNRMQFSAQSRAMQEQGIASSSLMDPKLKFGVGGLPVDSFRFDEDPMTNISVGLMQQFERGASQSLKQKNPINKRKALNFK